MYWLEGPAQEYLAAFDENKLLVVFSVLSNLSSMIEVQFLLFHFI